jgi:uncharacterized membrane protein
MPPLPRYDGLHPLVVHLPLGLLMFAPVLVLASLALRAHRTGLAIGALLLVMAGTCGAWVAVSTGEAAKEIAERGATDVVEDAMEEHEEAAERAAWAFTALALAYAALVGVPLLRRRELPRRLDLALHAAFLAAYAGGAALLSDAGHRGGLLVHAHGVRARTAESIDGPAPAAPDDGGGRRHRGR